jgi:hypothetical protein
MMGSREGSVGSRPWGNVELLTLTLSFPCNRKRYKKLTDILHHCQERALGPVPQRRSFLVEQAGKPVPKQVIEKGARCELS